MAVADVSSAPMLLNIPQRPPELGRIRLGEKGDKGQPVRLRTFRLTSGSKALLEAAAKLYGGTVKPWPGAPDEGQWQLVTAAEQLDILIPTNLRTVSQAYELWAGGANARRCDGVNVKTPAGVQACICAAKGLDGADRECELMTRLSVMLPRVPGLGVWRLDTGGWQAATTLPSTITLLAGLARGAPWMPAVLRAEQRSKKEKQPDGKTQTHRFVVPVLDLPGTTLGQFVELNAELLPAIPETTGGERPAPPTAAQVAAQRAEAIRARQNGAAPGEDAPWPDGATPAPNQHQPGGAGSNAPDGSKAAVAPPAAAEASAGSEPETLAGAGPADVVEGDYREQQPVQCEATSPYEGNARCRLAAGHDGHHKTSAKESWS